MAKGNFGDEGDVVQFNEGPNKGRRGKIVDNSGGIRIKPITGDKNFKGEFGEPKSTLLIGRSRPPNYSVFYNPKSPRRFTSEDIHSFMPHNEEQKKLIDGINMAEIKKHTDDESWTKDVAISGWTKNKSKKGILIKGRMPDSFIDERDGEYFSGFHAKELTTAQREGLYYNLANFMGMGKYVPTTAVIHDKQPGSDPMSENHGEKGNHYSVMQKIPRARHASFRKPLSSKNKKIFIELHDNGEIHKMALMNVIFGNTDRHGHNYMVSPAGLHLIDHGLTFDYHNKQRDFVYPGYLRAAQKAKYLPAHLDRLHPEARDWLMNINHDDLKNFVDMHDIHSDFKECIMNAFKKAQEVIAQNPDVNIPYLLDQIYKTWPSRKR